MQRNLIKHHLLTIALSLLLISYLPSVWAGATPVLYQASKGEQQIYLLGTIHAGRNDFYPLPTYVDEALGDSDLLVMEVDPQQLAQPITAQLQQRLFIQSPPIPLSQRLPAPLYARLSKKIAALGLAEAPLMQLRNWVVVMQMTQAQIQQLGLQAGEGVDHRVAKLAQQHQLPIHGLETTEFQLGVLAQMDQLDSATLFKSTLEELDSAPEFLLELENAWRTGDSERLFTLYRDYATATEQQALMQQLLDQRNQNWVAWLQQQPSNSRLFMLVGDMHLHGPSSVLAMLQEHGYSIQPRQAQAVP